MQHLKNYFVPHEGNDYKPAALKPKRLLFHTVGAVAAKLLVFAVISSFPLGAWILPDEAANASRQIIAKTNELRAKVNAAPLSGSDKLAQAAGQKVSDMLLNQYFAHTSPNGKDVTAFLKQAGYDYSMAGENLAMGFSSVDEVMAAWEKSPTHYANIRDDNFKEIGVAVSGGRFKDAETAMIAQYFGRPAQVQPISPPVVAETVKLDQSKTVLAVKSASSGIEKVLNVKVELPAGTSWATASVGGTKIALANGGDGSWSGSALVTPTQEKEITDPVVPASVAIADANGKPATAELDWSEVTPSRASAWEQYSVFKTAPSKEMRRIIGIGDVYLVILLGVVGLAALLNVLIEVKKQRARVIASSAAALAVLVVLLFV